MGKNVQGNRGGYFQRLPGQIFVDKLLSVTGEGTKRLLRGEKECFWSLFTIRLHDNRNRCEVRKMVNFFTFVSTYLSNIPMPPQVCTLTSEGAHESNCGSNTTSQRNAPEVTADQAHQKDKKMMMRKGTKPL